MTPNFWEQFENAHQASDLNPLFPIGRVQNICSWHVIAIGIN
jgi:hypothetical protein